MARLLYQYRGITACSVQACTCMHNSVIFVWWFEIQRDHAVPSHVMSIIVLQKRNFSTDLCHTVASKLKNSSCHGGRAAL